MKQNLPAWRIDNLYAFFVSIAVSVFAFASLYFGLSLKLELLTQKVEYLVRQTEEYNKRNLDIQTRLGTVESKQNQVVTLLNQHLSVDIK